MSFGHPIVTASLPAASAVRVNVPTPAAVPRTICRNVLRGSLYAMACSSRSFGTRLEVSDRASPAPTPHARIIPRLYPTARGLARQFVTNGFAIPGLFRDPLRPQLVFLHFPIFGRGQGVHQFDVARHGEVRQTRLAIAH